MVTSSDLLFFATERRLSALSTEAVTAADWSCWILSTTTAWYLSGFSWRGGLKKSWFLTSSSAVAERPRCRVHCDSYGQKWKTGTGRQYFTDIIGYYRSTFNHCDVIGQSSYWVRWKSKISAITPFKVIQGHQGWYQSKALMRLPIND